MRPLRKKVWVWAVSGLALTALLWSLPAVRVEYHKAKLQSLKEKRARLMSTGLSGTDKFLLQLTGTPISAADLNHSVQKHEDALVKLRFLRRESFAIETESNVWQAREALAALRSECPWQHVQMPSGTNLVLTACPQGMEKWRKRAQDLGWKSRGKT